MSHRRVHNHVGSRRPAIPGQLPEQDRVRRKIRRAAVGQRAEPICRGSGKIVTLGRPQEVADQASDKKVQDLFKSEPIEPILVRTTLFTWSNRKDEQRTVMGSFDDNHSHQDPDPAPRHHRDRGFSLIEVVVTVSIMGIILLPIFDSVITSVRASAVLSEVARVETVLQNAADRVNRAPKLCDYSVYAQAAAQSEGWTAAEAQVDEWRYIPAVNPTQAGTWVHGACEGSSPTDLLVQKVIITVTSPTTNTHRQIQVVKSDV